jgi:hypothetical protein
MDDGLAAVGDPGPDVVTSAPRLGGPWHWRSLASGVSMSVPLIVTTMFALSAAGATAKPPGRPPRPNAVSVTVENDRAEPVTVYVEIGDDDVRLGTLPAFGDSTFELPQWVGSRARSVDFFIHPERGFDEDTGTLVLEPGERLGILVPGGPATSSEEPNPDEAPSDTTTATIQNDRNEEVTVYLERGDADVTLGTIPAFGTATFIVPKWMLPGPTNEVDFFVHPSSGFDEDTGPVTLRAGERLGIRVPAR